MSYHSSQYSSSSQSSNSSSSQSSSTSQQNNTSQTDDSTEANSSTQSTSTPESTTSSESISSSQTDNSPQQSSIPSLNEYYTGILTSVDQYRSSLEIKIPLKDFAFLTDEKGNQIAFPDPRYAETLDPYRYQLPNDVFIADFEPIKEEHVHVDFFTGIVKGLDSYKGVWALGDGTHLRITPSPTNTITPTSTRTVTPTTTPSITLTPTISKTPSKTPTRTRTPTPTITQTVSVTSSLTLTPTQSISLSPTSSITPSISITSTASKTPTVTPTSSLTPTPTISKSPSPTATPTISTTPTISITPSITQSQTRTPTASSSPGASATPTVSITATPTITPTQTPTNTQTPTISTSVTSTITPTSSITPTISITPSISITPTATQTPSTTATPSITPSKTSSITPTLTTTPSLTLTPTNTVTSSVTPTPTRTPSITPSHSATSSTTPTPTITATPTVTPTPTQFPKALLENLWFRQEGSFADGAPGWGSSWGINYAKKVFTFSSQVWWYSRYYLRAMQTLPSRAQFASVGESNANAGSYSTLLSNSYYAGSNMWPKGMLYSNKTVDKVLGSNMQAENFGIEFWAFANGLQNTNNQDILLYSTNNSSYLIDSQFGGMSIGYKQNTGSNKYYNNGPVNPFIEYDAFGKVIRLESTKSIPKHQWHKIRIYKTNVNVGGKTVMNWTMWIGMDKVIDYNDSTYSTYNQGRTVHNFIRIGAERYGGHRRFNGYLYGFQVYNI